MFEITILICVIGVAIVSALASDYIKRLYNKPKLIIALAILLVMSVLYCIYVKPIVNCYLPAVGDESEIMDAPIKYTHIV